MSYYSDQDITSANAKLVLTVDELYPNGVVLQQASAESFATADNVQVAETRMGVDGYMAAGVTPNIFPVTINLEANSPSKRVMDHIKEAMLSNKKPYRCSLTVDLESTGETYLYYRGVMQSGTSMPSIQRVLSPTQWMFHFERMEKI